MAVRKLDFNISEINNKIYLGIIIAVGGVIAIVSLFLQSYAWRIPLELFSDKKVDFLSIWQIYLKANLGKYLPGNVLHFVERNLFAYNLGLSQFFVALSSVLEIMVIVITALVISAVFGGKNLLVLLRQTEPKVIAVFGGVILLTGIAAVTAGIKFSSRLRTLWDKIRGAHISAGRLAMAAAKMSGCYAAVLFLNGVCFALICRLILETDLNIGNILFLTICYILAWLVGYCVPGAPGGIGVREFTLILLTRSIMGSDSIYLAVIIQRLISIIGDVIGYLLSFLAGLRQKKRDNPQ